MSALTLSRRRGVQGVSCGSTKSRRSTPLSPSWTEFSFRQTEGKLGGGGRTTGGARVS